MLMPVGVLPCRHVCHLGETGTMPAVNPRIAVYLPKHVVATVTRLAGLRGSSRSAVIRDFLVEAEPVLQRVANMLDLAARTDRTALKDWAETMEAEQTKLEGQALTAFATMDDLAAHMKAHPKRKAGGRGQGRPRRPARTPGQ